MSFGGSRPPGRLQESGWTSDATWNIFLSTFSEKDFLAIWQLWCSWNVAGQLPDLQHDQEIFLSMNLEKHFRAIRRHWTAWKAAGKELVTQSVQETLLFTIWDKTSWPFGDIGPAGKLQVSCRQLKMAQKSFSL